MLSGSPAGCVDDSYNRALLRTATELAPAALHIVIHELHEIASHNGDVEAGGAPDAASRCYSARGRVADLRPSNSAKSLKRKASQECYRAEWRRRNAAIS
jgi:hypothetical protein